VKSHRVGRQVVTGPAQFQELVLSSLRRLEKLPATIRGFFEAPDLRYILMIRRLTNARISTFGPDAPPPSGGSGCWSRPCLPVRELLLSGAP